MNDNEPTRCRFPAAHRGPCEPVNDDEGKRTPDIEIKRLTRAGWWRIYGYMYWRPLIVNVLGRTIIDRRRR